MSCLQKWLLLCVYMASASVVLAEAMGGAMPSILLHDATARGCGQINGFYDRDGITLPPFFFDEQSENREYSAAYVCERDKRYFLVLLPVAKSTCKQRELSLGGTMPGGLAAFPRRLPLSMFQTISNSQQKSKSRDVAETTRFRPLVIDYDGVQHVFYCFKKRWIEAKFD